MKTVEIKEKLSWKFQNPFEELLKKLSRKHSKHCRKHWKSFRIRNLSKEVRESFLSISTLKSSNPSKAFSKLPSSTSNLLAKENLLTQWSDGKIDLIHSHFHKFKFFSFFFCLFLTRAFFFHRDTRFMTKDEI